MPGYEIDAVRTDNYDHFFKTEDYARSCHISISFPEVTEVKRIVLKENILCSQRIEAFRILADGRPVYEGTVAGYKKIAVFEPVRVKKLTIEILDARVAPTLSFIGVY